MTIPQEQQEWEETVADDGADTPDATATALPLEQQLAAAQAEAARNLDGWQRTQAEFANARKRFDRQRAEAFTNANIDLVGKLLPLIDDFERALESVPEDEQGDPWVSGVALVYRKLLTLLDDMDIQTIPSVGEPFDPNYHEALTQEPSDEYESGIVVREVRRGYRLGDRIIRPALVSVAP
ncbi:MAG: nucleotide exchange factor GrpE [Anaerolineae bacterium]|uniref:nucleotide exchange factor GrpE n=1 Tax=Promineifilum sp. TaxID=2664178 RepID=UPI001D8643D1|nr:nucleotide exchange factor GrpE [Anaerolineales bacterium]MCB8934129.1 nucleotide exchange factor GrpE [Promineifilum sp.]MCO5179751.1 nucleotide exchange factor GrpE [Promineifilum sp.]MCW5845689.1 nucleotide exchange factor GrpE [Anaerolineae bacterium]